MTKTARRRNHPGFWVAASWSGPPWPLSLLPAATAAGSMLVLAMAAGGGRRAALCSSGVAWRGLGVEARTRCERAGAVNRSIDRLGQCVNV